MKDTAKSFPQLGTEQCMALASCMTTCWACAKKCMEEGHVKAASACSECADMCCSMLKCNCTDSAMKRQVSELCKGVCKKCEEECRKIQSSYCQDCADMCAECAGCC